MQLTINTRERQGVTVLDLSGKIVAGEECESLRRTIRELLAANQKKILLNMGDVSRVDSTGIGGLVESVIFTAKQGGQLKLVNLPRLDSQRPVHSPAVAGVRRLPQRGRSFG